jgi:hypothetical protein
MNTRYVEDQIKSIFSIATVKSVCHARILFEVPFVNPGTLLLMSIDVIERGSVGCPTRVVLHQREALQSAGRTASLRLTNLESRSDAGYRLSTGCCS